jgi:hypothetical protein
MPAPAPGEWIASVLEQQIADLPDDQRHLLSEWRIEPRIVACSERGNGAIYLLGRKGNTVLGLDLIEEEFGLGVLRRESVGLCNVLSVNSRFPCGRRALAAAA